MNPTIKSIFAVVAGVVIGGLINMGLIMVSGSIIPPPEGAGDLTTTEGLKESIHLFEGKHYVFPFLAHALGTLFGALVTTLIASSNRKLFAMSIGALFLIGGIINAFNIPAAKWFIATDLILAYLPMAWIGYKLGDRR